jgi:hypothetical protein
MSDNEQKPENVPIPCEIAIQNTANEDTLANDDATIVHNKLEPTSPIDSVPKEAHTAIPEDIINSKQADDSNDNSSESSNPSKFLTYCDFKEMRKTLDAISKQLSGILSPEQLLKHLTFPMPKVAKEASRELLLLIVSCLSKNPGEKLFGSHKRKYEEFLNGNDEALKLYRICVTELDRDSTVTDRLYEAVIKNKLIMEHVSDFLKELSELFQNHGLGLLLLSTLQLTFFPSQ